MSVNQQKIINTPLDNIVGESYAKYAKYIIQDRALPDIRDGLKPVQRRILYAMSELGIFHDKPYKKSARTVGEVIGKYHPHGDSSIYEAMVRMSQDWKNNLCLLDIHGNKGSIDGDNAAAMRYTETRLSKIASVMLTNLKKDVVKFSPNFDDSEKEPSILPSLFPNLLINGATGIASGYATSIPPHNPNEVFDALIYRIDHPDCSIEKLIKICPAPDFPTGGEIHDLNGCANAHKTGEGKFVIRASIEFKTSEAKINQIIINSIPYETNKALIIKEIEDIIYNKEVAGLIEVRDESDAKGVSIIIDTKKDVNLENVKNYLYKKTSLEISYNTKFIAIVHRTPTLVSLSTYLDAQINHSLDVINKVDLYDLNKVLLRIEIVEGLIKCVDLIDEIIKIIRASDSRQDAKNALIQTFAFTNNQAEAIIMMRLHNLTRTDIFDLRNEWESLQQQAKILKERIKSLQVRKNYLKQKMIEFKKEFGYQRKTKLFDEFIKAEVNEDQMIEKQSLNLVISRDGYIKTVSKKSFESSKYDELGLKTNDLLFYHNVINSHDRILIITSKAKLINLIAHKISCMRWKDVGEHLNNYAKFDANEKVVAVYVCNEQFKVDEHQLVLGSKLNLIKRIELNELDLNKNSKQISIMKLNENDGLISANLIKKDHNQFVVAISKLGLVLMFLVHEINCLNRLAKGIKIMKLKPNDEISSILIVPNNGYSIQLFLDQGNKCFSISELKLSKRAMTPSPLYLPTKKAQSVLAAFLVGNENVFYLLDEQQKINPYYLPNPKPIKLNSKINKYENDLIITDVVKDSFLSDSVISDFKKISMYANEFDSELLKTNENQEQDDLQLELINEKEEND